jgi:hypothetical protein
MAVAQSGPSPVYGRGGTAKRWVRGAPCTMSATLAWGESNSAQAAPPSTTLRVVPLPRHAGEVIQSTGIAIQTETIRPSSFVFGRTLVT